MVPRARLRSVEEGEVPEGGEVAELVVGGEMAGQVVVDGSNVYWVETGYRSGEEGSRLTPVT